MATRCHPSNRFGRGPSPLSSRLIRRIIDPHTCRIRPRDARPCGRASTARAAPVDPPRAREALNTAPENWKKGDKIDALRTGCPPIVVQDFDWKNDDANLRNPARPTLRTTQGKEVTKSVPYVAGTSPVRTVFRDVN
jgi:hypothetical protein